MKIALEEAEKGVVAGDGGPFGAAIVKDSEVVAVGHNMVVKTNDPTAHAEIVAIRRASEKLGMFHLEGCVLYVTAEPCPMCFAAVHWAHIEKVVYCNTKTESAAIGFDDSLISDIMAKKVKDPVKFEHRPSPECREVFMKWYRDPNRIVY